MVQSDKKSALKLRENFAITSSPASEIKTERYLDVEVR